MKIRLGFVSNSSSSSFVLGFSKKPTCVADIEKELFPHGRDQHVKADYFDEVLHTWEVARMVFDDIDGKKGVHLKTLKAFTQHCAEGYFEGYPESNWSPDRPHAIFEKEFSEKHKKSIQSCNESHPKEYAQWRKLLDEHYEEERRRVDEAAKEYAKKQWSKFKGKYVYALNYGDNHGIRVNGVLEHGNAWDAITHIRISHH